MSLAIRKHRRENEFVKPVLISWFVLACSHVHAPHAYGAENEELYHQRIYAPEKISSELQAAVDDLQFYLGRIAGDEFTVSREHEGAGILLVCANAADVPESAFTLLPEGSTEACCLWPDDANRLWMVARSDMGLRHAVYFYLEQLGCRFYFPSERWTIVPRRRDIRLGQPLAAKPAFRSRAFSGTGGFGGNLPLDPQRTLQGRWEDWQRRNRFGGEFRIAGHTGEAFNVKYKHELETRPEWRAMVDGKRVPWSLTAKFCAGNPEVVALYVKDRLETYRQLRSSYPDDPRSWGVSVEPADGGGHCTAPESLALGSVSDRVFHVANQVAKAVRQEFPDGHVTLFAYNKHAAVPSIPLEENVYVQVIPYAFQRTGLTPDQLLDAWSRKVERMGVYDYWSIPDWSHDLPDFDPLGFGPERLRGLHCRGVDSFLCESTYSSGAMGLAWYIGSRVAWQPDTAVDELFAEFVEDCFGPAAEPMRRMLRRWSQGFYLTSHELALSYRDIEEAWRLAETSPAAAARVADYGRYVEYLRRRFEYLQAERKSPEKQGAADRLMQYLWSIYDSSMIHAFRHSQLLARDEAQRGNTELGQRFDWRNHNAPGWASIHPLTDEEVRQLVEQGVKDLTPQDFVARRFEGPLTRLPASVPRVVPDDFRPELWPNNTLELDFLAEQNGAKFLGRVASENPVRFLVTDPNGKLIVDAAISTGPEWRDQWSEASFTATEPGLYRVQIVSQKRMFRFKPPSGVKLTMPGWSNSQGTPTPRLYFYIPPKTNRLAIYANYVAAGPPKFFDPDDMEVQPELVDQGHLILINVPSEHRGKIWSLERAKCPIGPLQMLNAPNSFAFFPEGLMVPRDALSVQGE